MSTASIFAVFTNVCRGVASHVCVRRPPHGAFTAIYAAATMKCGRFQLDNRQGDGARIHIGDGLKGGKLLSPILSDSAILTTRRAPMCRLSSESAPVCLPHHCHTRCRSTPPWKPTSRRPFFNAKNVPTQRRFHKETCDFFKQTWPDRRDRIWIPKRLRTLGSYDRKQEEDQCRLYWIHSKCGNFFLERGNTTTRLRIVCIRSWALAQVTFEGTDRQTETFLCFCNTYPSSFVVIVNPKSILHFSIITTPSNEPTTPILRKTGVKTAMTQLYI